jgi:catechol 2,3-dioxygenase-like lactoylglutathione lyase family enzyme
MDTTRSGKGEPVDMKLELVVLEVSDTQRTKAFYGNLGWRLDAYFATSDYSVAQMTPHHSEASIIFGQGVSSTEPVLLLAVEDIEAARRELLAHGVEVSEVFHDAGGGLGAGFRAGTEGRAPGRDPQGRSYASYASFRDPDGHAWLLQEIRQRLPGREWESAAAQAGDAPNLAKLLRETEEHHGQYEKTHGKHHWSDWYAPYLSARQKGRSPEEAAAAADRHMEEVLRVPPR